MRVNQSILLVDDDKIDIMTTKRALKEIHVINEVVVAGNGIAALEFLRDPKYKLPCIILLDLNMPKMNGIEFLEVIKNDLGLKAIPIIILTTSADENDKFQSYQHSVAGYIQKPVDYMQFVESMKTVDLYWTLNELPHD